MINFIKDKNGKIVTISIGKQKIEVRGWKETGYHSSLTFEQLNINYKIKDFEDNLSAWVANFNQILPWQDRITPELLLNKNKNILDLSLSIVSYGTDWRYHINFTKYIDKLRELFREQYENDNFKVGEIWDDRNAPGTYGFEIDWKYKISENTFKELFEFINRMLVQLCGAVEIILNKKIADFEIAKNEKDFTNFILIPLFQNLNFKTVQYYHGSNEFGKDIVLSFENNLGIVEYWGIQVKNKDISGNSESELNIIINQIEDAFNYPFNNLEKNEKSFISKLIVAINGKLKGNAKEKIVTRLNNSIMRNNVIFLDIDSINNLCNKVDKDI